MACCATVILPALLLQLSEGGEPALLNGYDALSEPGAGAFRRLLEIGVLEQQESLAAWDPCLGCDCGATERPIRWRLGRPFAACPADVLADTPLQPEMLRVYRLSPDRFAEQVGLAVGINRKPEEILPALWRLGELASGRVVALAMCSTAALRPGAFDRLRAIDRDARIVLIAAIGAASAVAALAERRIDVLRPDEAFLPSEAAWPIRVNRSRFDGTAPGHEKPLLIVNQLGVTATFHEMPLTLSRRDFQLLLVLVREANDGGAAALREDLYRALTEYDDEDIPPGDEQVDKSISRVRGALCAAAGITRAEGRKLIVAVRKHGYRLTVPRSRIQID